MVVVVVVVVPPMVDGCRPLTPRTPVQGQCVIDVGSHLEPSIASGRDRCGGDWGDTRARAMTTSIPPEFQKDYTWDAIVFSDGATYVCEARRGEARRGDVRDDDVG